jgi:hypothetical protein
VVERLGRFAVSASITGYSLAGVGVGLVRSMLLMIPLMVVAGACLVWTTTTLNSTAQLLSPRWVRGRTMSLWSLAFAGVAPLGAIMSGAVADAIGASNAYVVVSVVGVVMGLTAVGSGIPVLSEVIPPEFSGDGPGPTHVDTVESGPVMVLNSFEIDPDDLQKFVAVMNDLRLVRLRTGAYRWRLYREASDPRKLTEVFLTVSWQEHLNQHRRIDDASAALIRKARAFDQRGHPTSRHLLAVDVESPPDFDELVARHMHMHEVDGSVPLEQQGVGDLARGQKAASG